MTESRFSTPNAVRAALDAVWARSRPTHERRMATLEQALVALLAGRASEQSIEPAREAAHKLAGSLGTFGLAKASELASELERFWESGTATELGKLKRVAEITFALRHELTQASEKRDVPKTAGAIVQSALDVGSTRHSRPDVVIVEDDEALAPLVLEALAASGYATCLFTDGLTAVRSLCAEEAIKPRVILLDVELPKLNGFGVLRRLAQSGATKHSRVIMLTQRAREVDVQQATTLGVFDYVAKPFTLSLLLERVERALGSAD